MSGSTLLVLANNNVEDGHGPQGDRSNGGKSHGHRLGEGLRGTSSNCHGEDSHGGSSELAMGTETLSLLHGALSREEVGVEASSGLCQQGTGSEDAEVGVVRLQMLLVALLLDVVHDVHGIHKGTGPDAVGKKMHTHCVLSAVDTIAGCDIDTREDSAEASTGHKGVHGEGAVDHVLVLEGGGDDECGGSGGGEGEGLEGTRATVHHFVEVSVEKLVRLEGDLSDQ